MACPALQCRTRESVDLELEIGVAEDGTVEGEGVGRPCSRAQRSVCVQRLGSTKQIPKFGVDVGIGFRGSSFGSGLDGVVAAFLSRDVHVNISGGGRGDGLVGTVEVD